MSCCGNFTAGGILLGGDCATSTVTCCTHSLVDVVDLICGSGKFTPRKKRAWHGQRFSNKPVYLAGGADGQLDEDATMKASTFPIKPEDLLAKAIEVLASEFGAADGHAGSCLADDFQFVAPIVGPLTKTEFMRAVGSFKLKEGLPDLKDNSWWKVDPLEPNRVWFFSRTTGTHTGTFNFGSAIAATGRAIQCPPQAQSMLFNEAGKVYTLTVGYCMDKRIGNTEGLGGVFAYLKAIGKPLPFPEAQRLYNPSLRYEAFEHIAKGIEDMGFDPTTSKRLKASD